MWCSGRATAERIRQLTGTPRVPPGPRRRGATASSASGCNSARDAVPCGRVRAALPSLLLASACATMPRPAEPEAAILYRDLRRLVGAASQAGWHIDRYELDELLESALMSVCAVRPATRLVLDGWLEERVAALGGPVESAFAGDLDAISELLFEHRIRLLLRASLDAASLDCPFWLPADGAFAGRQIQDDRWLATLGGGGKLILLARDDRVDLNFGGAGRLLVGRGIGAEWAIFAGAELGGSASFPAGEDGRGSLLLGAEVVAPINLRYRLENSYLELEGGYFGHFTEDAIDRPAHGLHLGVAYGLQYTRQLFFLPGAVFGLSYERTFPRDGDSTLQYLKLGFRVVFDVEL